MCGNTNCTVLRVAEILSSSQVAGLMGVLSSELRLWLCKAWPLGLCHAKRAPAVAVSQQCQVIQQVFAGFYDIPAVVCYGVLLQLKADHNPSSLNLAVCAQVLKHLQLTLGFSFSRNVSTTASTCCPF